MGLVLEIPMSSQEPIVRVLKQVIGQLLVPGAPEQEHPHGPCRLLVEPLECVVIHLERVDGFRPLALEALEFSKREVR